MRAELGVGEDQFLLLMIGSAFIDIGLDRAAHRAGAAAGRQATSYELIAIGHDDSRSFVRMAQRLRVNDRFAVLHGRDDVPRFLQAADLLLHPAYEEPGGSVLLEAIVAGLPSISTDVCGHAAFVVRADAGRVMESPFRQDVFNGMVAEALEQRDTTRPMASKRRRVRPHRRSIQFAGARGGAHCGRCTSDLGAAQWPWRRSGR